MFNIKLSLLEIFFIEIIFWLTLWMASDYIASLLTLIVGSIVFAVLILSAFAELIERSKVPRQYFYIMAITLLTPFLTAAFYLLVLGGEIAFLK